MRLSNLKIDPDFRDCLPKMALEEYCQLEKNILKYGVQSPLIVWNDYIVDGHNRYDICFNNHIQEVPVTESHFESKEEALRWILENQLGRRNLSDFARNEVALKYKEVIARKAKERQQAAGGDKVSESAKSGFGHLTKSGENSINTRTEIAKIAGTNDSSVKRTEYILKNGTEEEIDRARKGGKGNSQGTIFREIKERIPPGHKLCSKCFEVKPHEEFWIDRSRADGLMPVCKTCYNEERRMAKCDSEEEKDCAKAKDADEMTIGQIKKMLKDENAEISLTEKDVIAMVESNVANFIASVKGILAMDASAFNKCKDEIRAIIETGISHLYEEAL